MTYEQSDENWAKGKPGGKEGAESKRKKDLNTMKARMGNGQSTPQDKELFNKWATDVDAGNASPGSTKFVNSMKNGEKWKIDETGGPFMPNPNPDSVNCPNQDCLGICWGPNTLDEYGGCCEDEDRDCAGQCWGPSIGAQHPSRPNGSPVCCDRTDPDTRAWCCKYPRNRCNPPCPEPGQIINAHSSNQGCWCTPGQDEHCCNERQLDSGNRCPGDEGYLLWGYEVVGDVCQCNEALADSLNQGGYNSREQCEAACALAANGGIVNIS